MTKPKRKFQIQCGEHYGIIEAKSIGAAWRKLTKGKRDGFAELARWTECYKGEPWFYQTPQSLDKSP
jgi:hypothetical protein